MYFLSSNDPDSPDHPDHPGNPQVLEKQHQRFNTFLDLKTILLNKVKIGSHARPKPLKSAQKLLENQKEYSLDNPNNPNGIISSDKPHQIEVFSNKANKVTSFANDPTSLDSSSPLGHSKQLNNPSNPSNPRSVYNPDQLPSPTAPSNHRNNPSNPSNPSNPKAQAAAHANSQLNNPSSPGSPSNPADADSPNTVRESEISGLTAGPFDNLNER